MKFNEQEIISNVREQLLEYNQMLKTIKIEPYFEIPLKSNEFKKKSGINSTIKKIININSPIIYSINCEDLNQRSQLINYYQQFNESNILLTRGKDRLNISRFNRTDSETLYIGSTLNDFRTRIK